MFMSKDIYPGGDNRELCSRAQRCEGDPSLWFEGELTHKNSPVKKLNEFHWWP